MNGDKAPQTSTMRNRHISTSYPPAVANDDDSVRSLTPPATSPSQASSRSSTASKVTVRRLTRPTSPGVLLPATFEENDRSSFESLRSSSSTSSFGGGQRQTLQSLPEIAPLRIEKRRNSTTAVRGNDDSMSKEEEDSWPEVDWNDVRTREGGTITMSADSRKTNTKMPTTPNIMDMDLDTSRPLSIPLTPRSPPQRPPPLKGPSPLSMLNTDLLLAPYTLTDPSGRLKILQSTPLIKPLSMDRIGGCWRVKVPMPLAGGGGSVECLLERASKTEGKLEYQGWPRVGLDIPGPVYPDKLPPAPKPPGWKPPVENKNDEKDSDDKDPKPTTRRSMTGSLTRSASRAAATVKTRARNRLNSVNSTISKIATLTLNEDPPPTQSSVSKYKISHPQPLFEPSNLFRIFFMPAIPLPFPESSAEKELPPTAFDEVEPSTEGMKMSTKAQVEARMPREWDMLRDCIAYTEFEVPEGFRTEAGGVDIKYEVMPLILPKGMVGEGEMGRGVVIEFWR